MWLSGKNTERNQQELRRLRQDSNDPVAHHVTCILPFQRFIFGRSASTRSRTIFSISSSGIGCSGVN